MARKKKVESSEQKVLKRIPRFKSREEEAEFWDTHSPEDFPDEWKEVELKISGPIRHVLQIELDGATLRALDALARSQGTHPIALLHRWIEQRLREGEVKP